MKAVIGMNCENFHQNAALYVYDELEDDLRHQLELHAAKCAPCQRELEQMTAMKTVFSMQPVEEPSASMLAASRMRLQEALEQEPPKRSWSRMLAFDLAGWMHQLRFSPALAAVLVIAGFASGALTTYRLGARVATGSTSVTTPPVQEASISGIRGIEQDPNDPQKVHIKFDRVLSDQAEGSINDPKIQQLLLYAVQSTRNPGVRMDSVNLLTQQPDNDQVREALMYSLRYDKNAGVRLKALDGLKDYVASDSRVRDAVLDALMKDENPGVRIEAINLLQPVKADTSVRETFSALAQNDKNEFIRTQTRRVLASLPEIE
jgi:HEAT repeats